VGPQTSALQPVQVAPQAPKAGRPSVSLSPALTETKSSAGYLEIEKAKAEGRQQVEARNRKTVATTRDQVERLRDENLNLLEQTVRWISCIFMIRVR
jgi:hypothetical protein